MRFCSKITVKIWLIWLLNLSSLVYCVEKESKCLSEKPSLLSISCPISKITRIIRAFYGYSWSGDCHYIEKDCIVDVPNDDLSCLGEGCSVKIIESPIILQECWSLMASYVQVDYECIPVEHLQNMCAVQESEYSTGYIVTPNYPSILMNDLSCPCYLQAPTGYTITIEVLDFRLPGCSQAGLTIWSDSSTYTHCLSIATGILPGSGGQNISMRLHSQNKKNNAGFLLKYYPSPINPNIKLKFVCYGTAQLWQGKESNQNLAPYSFELEPNIMKHLTNQYLDKSKNSKDVAKNESSTFHINFPKNTTTVEFSLNETEMFLTSSESPHLKRKEDRPMDWTIVIISVVASVIFLLILINALIWFIFSLKGEGDRRKSGISSLYPDNFYLTEIYKNNYQNDDDFYLGANNIVPGTNGMIIQQQQQPNSNLIDVNYNTQNRNFYYSNNSNDQLNANKTLLKSGIDSGGIVKPTHLITGQKPNYATWDPNKEVMNNTNGIIHAENLQYGFNFDENNPNERENNKMPLNESPTNNNKMLIKLPNDDKFYNSFRNDNYAESTTTTMNDLQNHNNQMFKYYPNPDLQTSASGCDLNHNQKKMSKLGFNLNQRRNRSSKSSRMEKNSQSKFNIGGIFNWVSKYPDFFSQSEQYENPGMVLDDDKLSTADNNVKLLTKTYKSDSSLLNDKNNYSPGTEKDYFSYKKIQTNHRNNLSKPNDRKLSRKNSIAALSDLESSASQVPINLQNPSYLFEEQEGSLDLRSEYSYCARNNTNSNSECIKNFKKKNDIKSWKEVF